MLRRYRWRFIFALVACVLGGLAWQINTQIRRSRLNEALYRAVGSGNAAATEHWLREGADANAKPSDFSVMLHSAPRPTLMDPTKWSLLATFYTRGTYGGVPVVFFVKDVGTARVLLAHGADPNAGGRGRTWLMMAASQGDLPVVRELLAHGAAVDRRATYGLTALQHAVVSWKDVSPGAPHEYPKVVRALMNAGADINALTPQGMTTVMIAKRAGRKDIIRWLRQAGAKG
jgi:ankyrin repeat protein